MKKYTCECCNFETNHKPNYVRHLKTNKHQNVSKMYPKCIQNVSKCIQNVSTPKNKVYICKYCNKSYKYSQGLSKHIKYTCKQNKDEDLKELVRLLNEKMDQKDEKIENMEKQLDTTVRQLEKRDKQISKLSQKLQINNIQNFQQNNIHFHLNSYKNTDLSMLDDNDFYECLKRYKNCVVKVIEKIHLNPEYPENMNLYISNIKENYIMMYDDNRWVLRDRNKELIKIYEDKEEMLDEWVEENKHFKPELLKMFKRYLQLKDSDENLIKELLKEIKIMIYNNKKNIKYFESIENEIKNEINLINLPNNMIDNIDEIIN